MNRAIEWRIVLTLMLMVGWAAASAQTPIRYMYDELGRLIAVVDPGGDTAVYHYDAVGNLLSIDRHASSAVSIISFSPANGPVGTTVTIAGTGFSSTSSQDTVSFNGTAAAITSATSTQLVVTVPSAATTGTIGATSPAGSATSAAAFTVASATTPTISSFTPTIGVSGASVTISGTNFSSTPANDRVLFNNFASAAISSASASSLSTAVGPLATSGHLTIATPFGTAVSADDFFVPPAPYAASDVDSAIRGTIGTVANVAVGTANKIGLLVFDATAGHRVSFTLVPGPISGINIYKPNGALLTTAGVGVFSAFVEPQTMPSSGTYLLSVDPAGTSTGTTAITAYDVPADLTGTITPGGSSITPNLATPGQNALYTLGTPSHSRVSLDFPSGPFGTAVTVLNADGSTAASGSIAVFAAFVDPWTFAAGQTLKIDPAGSNTGVVTLTAYDVPDDLTGTITPGGSNVTAALSTPGQNAIYTLGTPTHSRVSLKVSSAPFGTGITVRNPNGSTLVSTSTGSGAFVDAWTFASGQTIKVDPSGSNTGSPVLTLYDVPADATGSLTIGGSAVGLTTTVPSQNGSLTFAGTASQQVTVHVSSNSIGTMTVKLLSTTGSLLAIASSFGSSFNLSSATLPSSGTYTITVDPWDDAIGSVNISVSTP